MADSLIRLRVDSQEYDNKLKRAAEGLNRYIEGCRKAGGTLEYVDDGVKEFTQQLGKMGTVAGGAKGKLGEMTKAFTDLTMQFNEMSEAEKHGQFGKALSAGLDELKQRIISTKQELADINSSLNGDAIGSGGSLFSSDKLSGMLQVFGGNLMTKGAGMALSFAGELKDMVAQGIELAKAGEGVRLAFQRLGRGDILQGLREATHGTVTDLELMKAAVKFNDFKLPLDELGTMLAFAQQKAKDTGQSVDYMVDSIVTGLGRKSLMILDNLGLSAAEIKEKMAETGDMTKAVGAIIREQMSKAGDYVETAADRATQANVNLQNKMEELGRKFLPVKQASDDLWTSIKIGILDIVGGPLADLLNGLTRAGQLRNELKNIGSDERVNSDIEKLKGSNYKPQAYQMMLAKYSREEQKALDNYKKAQKGGMGSIAVWENRYLARKTMREDFQARGRGIAYPTKIDIKTDDAEQNKGLRGGTTTTTTTTHQTPQQRAQESFTKAEQNYKQALEQAAMELEAGRITRAQAKEKEMQAAEQRWKAIGDARNINDSENLRKAQDEAAANYKALAAEVKTATERQKAIDKATRDLENANQKLAAARTEMAQAKQQGDLQAYNTAKDKATAAQKEVTRLEKVKVNVETGTVDLPDIPKVIEQTVDFQASTRNIDAAISYVKKEMDTIPVGTIAFNLDQTKLADLTTLKTLISEQMKNGLQIDPNFAQSMFKNIQAGKDIENTTWQAQVDNINEERKEMKLDPLKIDYKTGEVAKPDKETKKLTEEISTFTSGLSSIAGGLKSMGVDLPEEVDQVIGVIQGVTSVIEGVNAVISIFSTSAMSANTAALIANTAALYANAATNFLPFANGGVVHAAGGTVVGNTYSGDQIPAMLNAGEVVLNRAQTGNLASQLEGGIGAMQLSAIITGEQLRLILNNNGRRTGRGEYVTTNFR